MLDQYDTTIEDKYRRVVKIDRLFVYLELIDTAGQDDYQSLFDSWIEEAQLFLIVYAIDDPMSYEIAKTKLTKIISRKPKAEIMLVGNKVDLESERLVAKADACKYATAVGVLFMETSALVCIYVANEEKSKR